MSASLSDAVMLRFEALAEAWTGDFARSRVLLRRARDILETAGAIDEVIETDLLGLQSLPRVQVTSQDHEVVRRLEAEASQRSLGRLCMLARLLLIQSAQNMSPAVRVEDSSVLCAEASESGLWRIGIDAAYEELMGRIEMGDLDGAVRCQATAMDRLKAVSEGLRDYPAYRDAYFRDPRRRRFLEAGRRIAAMR